MNATVQAPAPQAVAIGANTSAALFGWFHPPAMPSRNCAVVLCPPLHYELICTHRAYRKLALRLAEGGFPVVRFDYAGTGDSPGGDADEGRVRAWVGSVRAALTEARRLAGTDHVALFGLRAGGLLAMAAAKEEEGGVEAVVTWGAVTGRGYVREIKAFNGARASSADPRSAAARAAGQGEEAAGFLLTPQTMSDLAALEAVPEGRPLAARVLVLDRTDLAGDQKLYDRLAASAKVLERRAAPGYLQMMAYPHLSVVPDEAWAAVEEFLGRAHPRERSQPHEAAATPFRVEGPAREEAVRFDGDRLFGIVCEPPAGAPAPSEKSAVLLLTMACHHRIGPNRLHTRFARELAAKGYGSLRFDVSGTGDSAPTRDGRENTASRLDQADDVVRAMDLLQARGYRRFCAVGVCSGAFFGFHAALADPRLVAMVAVNPQKLEPNEDGEVPEESPTGTAEFKGTASYKRALFAPQTWLRLLRGEINVRRIAAELARRGVKRLTSSSQASYLLTRLKRLTARGFRYLMIFGADDVNKDYVERCLGPDASRLGEPDRVRVVTVAGAEHTFGQMWAQDELSGLLSSTVSSWLP